MAEGTTIEDDILEIPRPDRPHLPVLVSEVLEGLQCGAQGLYIDATVGYGGHAEAILEASAPDGRLIGIDQDEEAAAFSRERLRRFGSRATVVQGSFFEMASIVGSLGIPEADGILLDLGVSSAQLKDPERGFSFSSDGPLDMRMDRKNPVQASDLVNQLPAEELEEIFSSFGEERWSRRIARAIVRERTESPITRTLQLAELVNRAIPARYRPRGRHPATRVFQALRIAVNRELEGLAGAVEDGISLLKSEGRIAAITFHSLEDRVIKEKFRDLSRGCVCPRTFPVCVCGRTPLVRLVVRKPIVPSPGEVRRNPRSRSAKLRVAEKI
jgi:16S rRNA (cytosine1402-N4)-methyltransferase